MMNLKNLKKIHIIGIGGAGTSAVARFLLSQGVQVTGSDLIESEITRKLQQAGITVHIGENSKDNVEKGTNAVIFSSAVRETNPERQQAGKFKIPSYDYHEFLGMMTEKGDNVVICGSHGKTTTTALTGLILQYSQPKPTTLVGSPVRDFNYSNILLGSDQRFVIEGDEYNKGILYLNPSSVVLTNVDHDHFDTYPNLSDYLKVFEDFVHKLPEDGHFIYNIDDKNIVEHIEKPHCHIATFGIKNSSADLFLKNHKIAHGRQIFKCVYKGTELKDFNIRLPGAYNLYNAMAAALLALELGVSQDAIKDTLATFSGAARRFEPIGFLKGATVISDYAHHPTALAEVIKATKEFYPEKRIIVYFQPHQKNRTKATLNEFADVLSKAEVSKFFLHEIYDVAGRSEDDKVSSQDIIKKIKNSKAEVVYVPDFESGKKLLKKEAGAEDLILIAGAGDVDSELRTIVVN